MKNFFKKNIFWLVVLVLSAISLTATKDSQATPHQSSAYFLSLSLLIFSSCWLLFFIIESFGAKPEIKIPLVLATTILILMLAVPNSSSILKIFKPFIWPIFPVAIILGLAIAIVLIWYSKKSPQNKLTRR